MGYKNYKNEIIENIITIVLFIVLFPIMLCVGLARKQTKNGKFF